jgi:hypothetical protein
MQVTTPDTTPLYPDVELARWGDQRPVHWVLKAFARHPTSTASELTLPPLFFLKDDVVAH